MRKHEITTRTVVYALDHGWPSFQPCVILDTGSWALTTAGNSPVASFARVPSRRGGWLALVAHANEPSRLLFAARGVPVPPPDAPEFTLAVASGLPPGVRCAVVFAPDVVRPWDAPPTATEQHRAHLQNATQVSEWGHRASVLTNQLGLDIGPEPWMRDHVHIPYDRYVALVERLRAAETVNDQVQDMTNDGDV